MNSHFSVHADQQLQHFVPAAFRTLQSSHPSTKHQSLELERTPLKLIPHLQPIFSTACLTGPRPFPVILVVV